MTREEAIEIINRENDPNDKKVWELFPEYREALDMAIQALEQNESADVEQIDYHDDFETALKKMQDYEERQTEKNCDTCINKDKCSPNIREIVRKNGCPKWTPNKDMYEPLLPMGKYLKTSFPCDAEEDVKQTKQEPCDDVVSRDAIRKILARYHLGESMIAEELNELPSVTQKSKTGHTKGE